MMGPARAKAWRNRNCRGPQAMQIGLPDRGIPGGKPLTLDDTLGFRVLSSWIGISGLVRELLHPTIRDSVHAARRQLKIHLPATVDQ
jgi:hypothetical protein